MENLRVSSETGWEERVISRFGPHNSTDLFVE